MSLSSRRRSSKPASRNWPEGENAADIPPTEGSRPSRHADTDAFDNYAHQPSFNQERIGDILRRTRERRGENLYAISEFLRIRPNFLASLENSQYEDLPADAYVIGFLRSYALYLGLDGKAAIDQYRHEMAGHRNKPQLNMPQPISEGRAPTFALLVSVTLAALLLYALWYSLSSSSRTTVETPASLTQPAPLGPAAGQAAPVSGETAPATPLVDPATSSVPGVSSTATDVLSAKNPSEEVKTAEEALPPATQPAAPPAQDVKDVAQAEETRKTESSPLVSPPEENKAIVYGSADNSRLAVRALGDSWVLITDGKGNTVFDKILKPGDVYHVPNRNGLKLTTGNGGGIVLNFDGQDLPKVGPDARIVRNVPLDPEKLKTGKIPSAD